MKKDLVALALITIFLCSCSDRKDGAQCVKVRYSIEYCAEAKPLHLVTFLEPNTYATPVARRDSTVYLAAIIDLPEDVQKKDSIFYLYFHYDKKLAKSREPKICPAMFSSVNILVCDIVSNDPCKIPF